MSVINRWPEKTLPLSVIVWIKVLDVDIGEAPVQTVVTGSFYTGDESNEDKLQVCPHCHVKLTPKEVTTMLHGTGFKRYAWVEAPNGERALLEVGQIYPSLA